ncbi:MAG TPA: Mut7-C RNAse domain-containing protein [Syntrophorhabdales bacterium]|nr:Mut7-C RNAse domain-containing protein [Syntrophorhabdales bacterium]
MRFVCDAMLGKLAKYLRILGFDAEYLRDVALLQRHAQHDDPPYFLTRRRKIPLYSRTIHINSEKPQEQLLELRQWIKPFFDPDKVLARCINCNVPLVDVNKETIEYRVPEFVFHTYSTFKMCPGCNQVYWAGTHREHMAKVIAEVTS